jgi:hypothetical protein
MVLEVLRSKIHLPCQLRFINKPILFNICFFLEHDLGLARFVHIQRGDFNGRDLVLAPLLGLGNSDNGSRKSHLVTGIKHVLTSSTIHADKKALVESSVVNISNWLLASDLERATFAKRHKLGSELATSYPLISGLSIMPFCTPSDKSSSMPNQP